MFDDDFRKLLIKIDARILLRKINKHEKLKHDDFEVLKIVLEEITNEKRLCNDNKKRF